MKLGLALPKWLVEKDNNFLVLFIYAMAFGIGMPLLVVWFSLMSFFFSCFLSSK
jgi:preprotein translocase subunit Sec63